MRTCPMLEDTLRRCAASDADSAELESVRRHAATCSDCQQVLELEEALRALGQEIPTPSDTEFRSMRMRVIARLRRRRGIHAYVRRKTPWTMQGPRWAVAAIALVSLLGSALLLGRWSASPRDRAEEYLAGEGQAYFGTGVSGRRDAAMRFHNVAVRSVDDGRIALAFDVSWHVELEPRPASELPTEVLVHAILNPDRLATQLNAIELTGESSDMTLREAVVFALHHDPSLAVRLEALEVVSRSWQDEFAEEALLVTLSRDESVQMRLRALEALEARQVATDVLLRTILTAGLPTDTAVLHRANALRRDL